ncbi:hypothetical protein K1719_013777 [Acacia pycnantha]|nr:hypothetical protein K1719_013777 [Acacia pycnantha]
MRERWDLSPKSRKEDDSIHHLLSGISTRQRSSQQQWLKPQGVADEDDEYRLFFFQESDPEALSLSGYKLFSLTLLLLHINP